MSADAEQIRIHADDLRAYCCRVLASLDVTPEDAETVADVLVNADLRGVHSHGIVLLRSYAADIRQGIMRPNAVIQVMRESPATALVDGGGGIGQVVSKRAMTLALDKAEQVGAGFVSVRNSNHYGIAGYWAMMALERDLIGISLTNASPLMAPTFGRNAILGTNPISLAAPTATERPFVLDMATSVVPASKLAVFQILGQAIPLGWATDENGRPSTDTDRVVKNLQGKKGGGLMPLGGATEELGGHKGYGLALMVDILSGVLSGADYADKLPAWREKRTEPDNHGHFFGALRIDAFRDLDDFKRDMDDILRRLKDSPTAEGQERIWVAGEKEWELMDRRAEDGIPFARTVIEVLNGVASDAGVAGVD